MGLFDQLICTYPLPDPEAEDLVFQTKSLDACLETFFIAEDGRLHLITKGDGFEDGATASQAMATVKTSRQVEDFHGDIYFYEGHRGEWYEYRARFTEGQLTDLRRVPKGRGNYVIPPTEADQADRKE